MHSCSQTGKRIDFKIVQEFLRGGDKFLPLWGGGSPTFGYAIFSVLMESTSKETINNNDLNLHSMTKLSGWLRYCPPLNHYPIGYDTG